MALTAPDVDYRELTGYGDAAAPQPPPPYLEPEPTSDGSLKHGSYRRSRYHRMSTKAVANDDGSPIAARVEALLLTISAQLAELIAIERGRS